MEEDKRRRDPLTEPKEWLTWVFDLFMESGGDLRKDIASSGTIWPDDLSMEEIALLAVSGMILEGMGVFQPHATAALLRQFVEFAAEAVKETGSYTSPLKALTPTKKEGTIEPTKP